MSKHKTDWEKVRTADRAGEPIPYDPETDPYDPNDEQAVRDYWAEAKRSRPGRPPAAVKRPTLNMRVDPDVLEHLRQSGRGWQTRVNKLLREAMEQGRL